MLKHGPFEIGFAAAPGQVRGGEPSQDALEMVLPGFLQAKPALLLVADGIGGASGGEVASRLVARTIRSQHLQSSIKDDSQRLLECIHAAHSAVRESAKANPENYAMGTTLAAAVLRKDHLIAANLGDSRIYQFTSVLIQQISQDHTLVAEGVIPDPYKDTDAASHLDGDALTMALSSARKNVSPHLTKKKLHPNGVILLCTDGLWRSLPESAIQEIVMDLPPQRAAYRLIDKAHMSGAQDDISVIVVRRRK